ncbi:MAG: SulP family inorganic anion transporter [Flavobacteriales bacterium]|jgi:SulP family sulfate permease|nr:STAS domain-containing protein [Flavobacteriales bacterium]MCI1753642.1 SulP family inorganic anion transporter [Flavobacteriales bacterium]
MRSEFTPKLFTLWKAGIPKEQLRKDFFAGITVGIVALPLAIAFAIASGVTPEKGLITAIIGGLVISIFGGSRVQIGGPTGAFIVIVYGIVQKHGVDGLTIATLMAGVLMVAMGLLRFGNLLKFFPHTLVLGFTSGIAVIILSSQVKDFFGLDMGAVPSDFIEKWTAFFQHFGGVNATALAIGAGSVLISVYWGKITRVLPGPMVAILLSTAAVALFHLPVSTIEDHFGAIPRTLPSPEFHTVSMSTLRELVQPALAIALLGSIESLLSATVADSMIGGQHRSNMELVAQGGANVLSALFGGIPATGAIARTATNVKNGGRTPVAGIVHAITLLAIMLLVAPLAGKIPLACLAGILVVVAYNMSEWRGFVSALKGNRYDVVVLLATFFITVIFDLVLAIEVGMVLAAFLFMKRMSDITDLKPALTGDQLHGEDHLFEYELKDLPSDVMIFEITGPLFFGAAQKFQEVMGEINDRHRVVILRMQNVPLIDATGLHRLKEIVKRLTAKRKTVYLTGVDPRVRAELDREDWVVDGMVRDSVAEALAAKTGK